MCFRDTSPGFQFQLRLSQCWVWGNLLWFSETGLPHAQTGSDGWLLPSPEWGTTSPRITTGDGSWSHLKAVIPGTDVVEWRAEGLCWAAAGLALGPMCPCHSEGSPLPVPRLTPHSSLPSQFLLAELSIFRVSEENHFFREAFSHPPDQVGSNIFSLSWQLPIC